MSSVAVALRTQRYELAALALWLGLLRTLAQFPPESLEGLLEVLEGEERRRRG